MTFDADDPKPKTGPAQVRVIRRNQRAVGHEELRYTERQIALVLKQIEDGTSIEEVCLKISISQQMVYRCKKRCGGILPAEVRRLKQLEYENSRLEQLVANLSLDKIMLLDVLK